MTIECYFKACGHHPGDEPFCPRTECAYKHEPMDYELWLETHGERVKESWWANGCDFNLERAQERHYEKYLEEFEQ